MKSISELRQDPVSEDWVVIATGRTKRPHEFLNEKRLAFIQPKRTCPFETLHQDALLVYGLDGGKDQKNWWVQAVPNKYPAFGKGTCSVFHTVGPYQWTEGAGFHEVVATREHTRSFAQMSTQETERVVRVYQERYLAIRDDDCVEYISIFHNHGKNSGASISHPHSQLIGLPVIPPDVGRSLRGSASYFKEHKSCIHCLILKYDLQDKSRVIYENEGFAVAAPYASKTAFEIRIFPKSHSAHFEEIDAKGRTYLADALRVSLAKLYQGLGNPDYNFFLHTAPIGDTDEFDHYHWHFEILPKTAIWAGFEIGTGIEISVITPEGATAFLKKIKV